MGDLEFREAPGTDLKSSLRANCATRRYRSFTDNAECRGREVVSGIPHGARGFPSCADTDLKLGSLKAGGPVRMGRGKLVVLEPAAFLE
jgi:hypothetical protein